MGGSKRWLQEIEEERRRNVDRFTDSVAGQEDKLSGLLERLDVIDGFEARIDFLESLHSSIEQRINSKKDDAVEINNDGVSDDLLNHSVNVKRGVAAYGLKSLGKTNREIALILWPGQEYDADRHATYIRRDVRLANRC